MPKEEAIPSVSTEDQISAMLDGRSSSTKKEEEKSTPEKEEETTEEETPKEEEEPEEEDGGDEEEEESGDGEEGDEEESGDDEEEEEEEAEDTNKALDDMRAFMQEEARKANQPTVEEEPELEKFEVTQEVYDRALESPEEFGKVISSAIKIHDDNNRKLSQAQEKKTSVVLAKVDAFYESNPDLKPFDEVVTLVAKNLRADHKDWGIDDVLKNAETIVRDKLRLPKSTKKEEKKETSKSKKALKVPKPNASPPKRGKEEDKRTTKQKQIDDLIDAVDPRK